jgi:hypothetical protein
VKRHSLFRAVAWIAALAASAGAQAPPKPAAQDASGFTSYVEFGGTSNSEGQIYELNSSVGYDFSRHFGADVGVPIFFVRPSTASGGNSTNGLGNPYLDLRVKFLNPAINFGSVLTGWVPVGDSKKGLSTGRGTFDWTNHFDHSFSKLTPFAEVGIANTIVGSQLFVRPFTTLGFNTHFQAGAKYDVWRFFNVGASAYDIVPTGSQTVFSRVHGNNPGHGKHGRVFEDNQQTRGSADIAKDNGFSAWIGANPGRVVNMELGFTRSTHLDLNSVSFVIGFNLQQLYRRTTQ